MPLPNAIDGTLRLPVIVAPMFLVSGVELVLETCRAGLLGTFPSLNHRTAEALEDALIRINRALASDPEFGHKLYGVNLIVNKSNARLEQDLDLCVKHRVPLIITSLGANADIVRRVHAYSGLIFHDATTLRHARKAAEAGVDGLILVCAGAGGHGGSLSPFALLPEVREFFSGTIALAGAISDGRSIAAARVLGADMVYVGTRFIATRESAAPDIYKQMIHQGSSADIVYTADVSGVPGNFLRASIRARGLDPDNMPPRLEGFRPAITKSEEEIKAWKHIWAAGQGIGSINDEPTVADLVARLEAEYRGALAAVTL